MCYLSTCLFNNFGIRLKLKKQRATLDSNCAELEEQKHDSTIIPSQVLAKEIHSVYTIDVAYKPYCSTLMTKSGSKRPHIVNSTGRYNTAATGMET